MAINVPEYSYSGNSSAEVKNGYWYIYLKSSGELTMKYPKRNAEICIVGGGGGGKKDGGSYGASAGGGADGGDGGEVVNTTRSLEAGIAYSVVIGEGGAVAADGQQSSFENIIASGGAPGDTNDHGSQPGADGIYAFGDTSLIRYGAGGGNGGLAQGGAGGKGGADAPEGTSVGGGGGRGETNGIAGTAGAPNTGNGGGGAGAGTYGMDGDEHISSAGGAAAAGGSGIVIMRGTEEDFTPVWFNGIQISEIFFGGQKAEGMIYDGTRLFARLLKGLRCAMNNRMRLAGA